MDSQHGLPPQVVAPREQTPGIAGGLLALAIAAPVVCAAVCLFAMFILWRRIDHRNWRGVPEVQPKKVPLILPRSVKIPVVVLEPDRSFAVGYHLQHSGHSGTNEQPFSVVVLADTDTCGPLWRAHSLALSESSATPRGERALGVLAAAGLHSSSPSVGSTGELVLGQAPLGFSLSPLPPEGCLPCYPQSPELAGASSAAAEAAAAAAGPKGGGHRRQSWDAAGAKGKIKAAHSRQRSWDVAAARAEPQERQAGCRIMPPPPPPLGRSAPSTSAGPAAPGAFA